MAGRVSDKIRLRKVKASDLPTFFEHQLDPVGNRLAAITAKDPTDRAAVVAHWTKVFRDPNIVWRTVLVHGRVLWNVVFFELFGKSSVAYWFDRGVWGRGVAPRALQKFLRLVHVRPLFFRGARDDFASVRLLEKCGFTVVGRARGFAPARGKMISELILRRDAP
ncbi:MAG: GNAT family N-acetyltransferase [Thermoplasmata archaeon]|nr:GNAT family N-acetyltransferase [Thermoplasmata archaeon]